MNKLMPSNHEELLTIQQVAERFHVNHKTVRNWIHSGILEVVILSERVHRIREADLNNMVTKHVRKGGC